MKIKHIGREEIQLESTQALAASRPPHLHRMSPLATSPIIPKNLEFDMDRSSDMLFVNDLLTLFYDPRQYNNVRKRLRRLRAVRGHVASEMAQGEMSAHRLSTCKNDNCQILYKKIKKIMA